MEKNTKYLEDLYSKRQVERIEEVKADAKKSMEYEMQKQMEQMMKSSGQGVLNQQSGEVANQPNSKIINQEWRLISRRLLMRS